MFDPIQEKAKIWAEFRAQSKGSVDEARKRAHDTFLKREIGIDQINYEPDYCAHDKWLEQGNDNQTRNSYMVNESTRTL